MPYIRSTPLNINSINKYLILYNSLIITIQNINDVPGINKTLDLSIFKNNNSTYKVRDVCFGNTI
jgi:hypothetical protein